MWEARMCVVILNMPISSLLKRRLLISTDCEVEVARWIKRRLVVQMRHWI